MNNKKSLFLLGLLLSAYSSISHAEISLKQAQDIFSQYSSFEKAFNPALADLYCDNALIRNTRNYPNGQSRTMEISAPQYKNLIRQSMPLAKLKGDYSTYKNIQHQTTKGGINFTATRHSELKNYDSPISVKIGACSTERVGILEEISVSQPF